MGTNENTASHQAPGPLGGDEGVSGPSGASTHRPLRGRRSEVPLFKRFAIPREWRMKDTGGGDS
jgi:hypothetical protein